MKRISLAALAAACCAVLAANPVNALVIQPYFDPSITNAQNAAQIMSAINAVTSQYSSLYTNPVTVNIYFQQQSGNFLGSSQSTYYFDSYSGYTVAAIDNAILNPNNAPLTQGLISTFSGPTNQQPVILTTGANFRANGYGSYAYPGAANDTPGAFNINGVAIDTIITLSTDNPLDFNSLVPAYNGSNLAYNGRDVIEHEVDEALGIGGSGSALNFIGDGLTLPTPLQNVGYEGVLDRYRFSAPGVPGFSTDPNANAYFSLDNGVTNLAAFNQDSNGDFGDLGPTNVSCGAAGGFGGPFSVVQDAFACYNLPTTSIERGSIEDTLLQSVGWDPTPEPATWAMMILGLAMIGFAVRRRPGNDIINTLNSNAIQASGQ